MKPILKNKNNGFSLLELLVAIFLGALVVTAVYSLFIMQNQSYINQNVVSEMQQNVRMAMNILSAEFRMAGFGFSINGDYRKTSNTVDYAVTPTNSTSSPDSIRIRYGINPTTLTTALASAISNGTIAVSSSSGFAKYDYIILADGQNASRLQIRDNPSGNTLPYTGVTPSHFPTGGYGIGSRVYKLKEVRYQISNYTLQSSTDLGVTWQDVVYQIEDMQLAYQGTDTLSGIWIDNPSPVDRTTITDVQLNIMGRGGVADLQFTGQRPMLRDHPSGPTDHFRRRLLTSTVRMRNL